jgi:hypothetical protein
MATQKTVDDLIDLAASTKQIGPESLGLEQIRRVIKHPNVMGIGSALKITNGKTLKSFAFTVFVAKKSALSRLRGAEVVPPVITNPTGRPVATDVVEIGVLKPQANVKRRPIQPGFSVGHFSGDTGTLGAIVKRQSKLFVLSNSHVLARSGKAKKGDSIIYPGFDDGGKKKDGIANLRDFIKLKARGTNSVDTAIAEIDAAVVEEVMATIKGIGLVRGTIKAKAGMKVTKVGRTSNKTQGKVLSAKFRPLRMFYPGVGDIAFGDQILITRFSEPGDSGSLVVDVKSKKAIGLHFAGASGGSVSAPIARVLELMRVQLVTSET